MKNYLFLYSLILMMIFPSKVSSAAAGDVNGLKVELRGNEETPNTMRLVPQSNLHFLLFALNRDIRIFQSWNSWGYWARSFELTSLPSKGSAERHFKIARRGGAWGKNFPATIDIKGGDVSIADINLCNSEWQINPTLNQVEGEFQMVGIFSVKEDGISKEKSVWAGTIKSEPVRISISSLCQKALNKKT